MRKLTAKQGACCIPGIKEKVGQIHPHFIKPTQAFRPKAPYADIFPAMPHGDSR
jgi:hypothetical protein